MWRANLNQDQKMILLKDHLEISMDVLSHIRLNFDEGILVAYPRLRP